MAMTMSYNIDPRILEFIEIVESGRQAASKDVLALVKLVRQSFETEPIYTDEEQFSKYLSLQKYFPYTPAIEKAKKAEAELAELEEKRFAVYEKLELWKSSREHNSHLWSQEQLAENNAYIDSLSQQFNRLNREYEDLSVAYGPVIREGDKFQDELDTATAIVKSYDDEIANAQSAMELYFETMEDTASVQDAADNSIEATKQKMEDLSTSYQEAKDAAYEAISNQIGLFDELSTTSDWTAEKVIVNWKSQREAFSSYQSNLKKAKSLGLDDAIVEQLSDGSAESMQILNALVNDTHIRVADINKAFEGLDQSRKNVSSTLGDIQEDYTKKMEELCHQAGIWGRDISTSFTNGLNAGFGYRRTLPAVNGLSEQIGRVVQYPNLYSATPASMTSTTNSKTVNMGGITVQINAQPGQDVYEIAQAVSDVLQNEINREEAGL